MIKYRTEKPRITCTKELRSKLIRLGHFIKDGNEQELEQILKSKGFGLPINDGEHYHFMVDHKYLRYYLNYADALAEEIILLHELNLLK